MHPISIACRFCVYGALGELRVCRVLRPGRALARDPELLSQPAQQHCVSRSQRNVTNHSQEASLARLSAGRDIFSCPRNK